MDSVEIVVRFAGTFCHVAQLAHGKSFRIGTAPDVDLPIDIAPLTSFPLVGSTAHGWVVRCPAGVPAIEYTEDLEITVTESEITLARGSRIDVAFGQVMISITRCAAARLSLPRPRASYVPHVFAAGSLAIHLVMLAAALVFADIDENTVPVLHMEPVLRPVKIARFPSEEQKQRARRFASPKPAKHAGSGGQRAATAAEPVPDGPREVAIHQARRAGIFGGDPDAWADLGKLLGTADFEKELADVGPIYDEDAANAAGFGGSQRKFDPTKRPEFASVKTGRYATVATGRGAGDGYDLGNVRSGVSVAMCQSAACTAPSEVRERFADRIGALVDCYETHAPNKPHGSVMLTLDIDVDGKVAGVRISGLRGVGNCVAEIARGIDFPTGVATVKYPLAFSRS